LTRADDMRAALELRETDGAVPIWELGFYCWDQASGRHVVLGREFEGLTTSEQRRALDENADIILSVSEDLHFAAVTLPGNYWEVAPGEPAYYWLPEDARWEQTRIICERAPDDLLTVGGSGGVISPPMKGYVEFCYKLFDAPDEVEETARRTLAAGLENARRLRDAGVAVAVTSSDIADNHGPFFSPEQMRRFILPFMREWAAGVRELGLYAVLHSDGNMHPILDEVAETGLHAIQAVDPVAGMDMRRAKDQVGDRLCLCGNVDCGLLLTGPAERVYDATRGLLLTCKRGGGLVLGASNAVVPETPLENYLAMNRAWEDHGQY
jgi:uroporphyrinogen decarboxylase